MYVHVQDKCRCVYLEVNAQRHRHMTVYVCSCRGPCMYYMYACMYMYRYCMHDFFFVEAFLERTEHFSQAHMVLKLVESPGLCYASHFS